MKESLPFYLLFIAPIFQIILTVLRIAKRVSMPLGVIAFIAFVMGIIASIAALNISIDEFKASNIKCLDCGGMLGISFLAIGFVITFISTPVIGLIGYAIFNLNQKKEAVADEVIAKP